MQPAPKSQVTESEAEDLFDARYVLTCMNKLNIQLLRMFSNLQLNASMLSRGKKLVSCPEGRVGVKNTFRVFI